MTTLSLVAAATVLYYLIGVAAWRVAERRDLNGDTRLLIYGWLPVALIVAVGAWSLKAAIDGMGDVARDDRAQLTTPRWMPALLIGTAIVAVIMHEVGLL